MIVEGPAILLWAASRNAIWSATVALAKGPGVGAGAAAVAATGEAAGASSAWRTEVTAPRIANEATAASNRTIDVVFCIIGLVLLWRPYGGGKEGQSNHRANF